MNYLNKLILHIDIGHPAHVHYFKNLIWLLKDNGHQIIITARDKEITFELMDYYNFPYISRGKGGNNLISKMMYIIIADLKLLRIMKKNKCDLSLSFASTYAAHAAKIARIPHIAFDDTEHAKFELMLYTPFTDVIFTPYCFSKRISSNQIFYNSLTELLYLHKSYFRPDASILEELKIAPNEEYVIVRFVSWSASHDMGQKGLSNKAKVELVHYLAKRFKVFVSSEGKVPTEIEKYVFNLHPAKIHNALYFARLYVGEGGTTASESALLGTPAIYINKLSMGYIEEEKKIGLLFQLTELNHIFNKIEGLSRNGKKYYQKIAVDFIESKIDPTQLLLWFVENYPSSSNTLKVNPDFVNKF